MQERAAAKADVDRVAEEHLNTGMPLSCTWPVPLPSGRVIEEVALPLAAGEADVARADAEAVESLRDAPPAIALLPLLENVAALLTGPEARCLSW